MNSPAPLQESLFIDDLNKKITSPAWLQWFSDTSDIIDYSNLSTIVGWSSYTNKVIKYTRQGRKITVWFNILGTSNSTTTSFTIPFVIASTYIHINTCSVKDNSVFGVGCVQPNGGTSTITAFYKTDMTTWTNSGSKHIVGEVSVYI